MTTKTFLQTALQDYKFGWRTMLRNPGFALVVVLTMGVGLGSSTAMFSIIRAVLLKPLEYSDPEKIVLVADGVTPIRFEEMAANSRSYNQIGAMAGGLEDMALSGTGEPEVLKVARVSANFLGILGVMPLQGRSFFANEDRPGAEPVVLISAALWQRRFGSNRSIVGRTIMLAGIAHTVIGVLPARFRFPVADAWVTKPSEWSIISAQGRQLSPILRVVGRLKPNVSLRQANAELSLLNQQYAHTHPAMLDIRPDAPDVVQPLREEMVSDIRPKLWLLFGAVGFVLLIICANVASLLLARSASRARELAVRAAIGAGRSRIISQLLAESILLAVGGGGLGLVLAALAVRVLRTTTFVFVDLPRATEIGLDPFVLAFGAALALLTGLLFGLAPALTASRPDLVRVLRGSGEATTVAYSKQGFGFSSRGLLVIGQVALTIVLLTGAALLIESLARVYRVDLGFKPSGLLTAKVALSPTRYDTDEKRAAFFQELVERIQTVPGVRGAAVSLTLPMTDTWMGSPVQLAGVPVAALNERPISIIQDISPSYFRAMGIALKRGREFTTRDNIQTNPVAIVNENLVRLFWRQYPAGPDPIGQHILIGSELRSVEIIGIAANVRQSGRDDDPRAEVYFPCSQKPPQSAMLAVRTNGDPSSLAKAVKSHVLALDPDQPLSEVVTMQQLVEDSEGQLRLMMRLLGSFAAVATLLAVLGLYGVVSYSVVQRTREIGIRRALGAPRANILLLIGRQVLTLTLGGIAIGVGGAVAVTRLLRDLLFQVRATDAATLAGISFLFVLVALSASYIPVRRAARVDPMVALRS